jgi:hypothetical protein
MAAVTIVDARPSTSIARKAPSAESVRLVLAFFRKVSCAQNMLF